MSKVKKGNRFIRFSDVEELEQRILNETPKSGEYFYDYKLEEAKKEENVIDDEAFHFKYKINFEDLPISHQTMKGLRGRQFTKMTEIQRCTVPHALAERDIIACSRTGSGKTLAYLVPLVEKLYRQRFIPMDGLGAMIIVPVRELAMQVFQVLNSFTEKTEISVGLIIGGKDIKIEKEEIKYMNIIVCTPGRILQHLQETYGFQTSNMKMLILDEADQMVQMGFRQPLNKIMENLPKCQTLFFSATINKQIHNLSQICTSEPQRVFLHSSKTPQDNTQLHNMNNAYEIPVKLTQYYMVVKPQDKLNTLYSFLKNHQKQKILIFLSTCKQVRFLYESFKKFRMATPMYELQGHQKQNKRMAIYYTFCEKKYGILFCTNIASRGLDFPKIDWVLQLDIPDDIETYIHRVGRTARYKSEGKSIVLVSENQEPFVNQLKQRKVRIFKISQNPEKYLRIESSLQSICSEHQDVKYLAQRALISYLKFIHKAKSKDIFNLKYIDAEKLSNSFGLMNAPTINIITQKNNEKYQDEEQVGQKKPSKFEQLKINKKIKKAQMKQTKLSQKMGEVQDNEKDGQLFKIKNTLEFDKNQKPIFSLSKRQQKKIKPEGHFQGLNKTYFIDGKTVTHDEYRRMKHLNANKTILNYNPLQDAEERLELNKEADDTVERDRRKQKRRKINEIIEEKKGGAKRVAVLDYDDEEGEEEEDQQ